MKMRFQRTALWAAMVALSLQGNGFAQGMIEGSSPPILPATDVTGSDLVAPMEARFSTEQIEQLVAPIALYPDALLAQVLMAAGYPLEVVQAARWLGDNTGLEGQALDDAIARQPWDPSIKTLVFFPSVLQRMNDNLDWTQDLGDAFLAQEAEVMDSIQRLRRQAHEAGSLVSNDKQIVSTFGETIVVEPADPATVYVPTYNPTRVYGSSWAPTTVYYPAVYSDAYYPSYPTYSTYDSSSTWLAFGAGALVGALLTSVILWDDYDDHHHHHYIYHGGPRYWDSDWYGPRRWHSNWHSYRPKRVDYNTYYVDRSKTVNIQNNYYGRPWQHNPRHREGVSYRDVQTTKRYLKVDEQTAIAKTRPTRLKPVSATGARTTDFAERRDRIRTGEGFDRRGEGADALRSRDRQGVEGLRDELSRDRVQRQEALRRQQGAEGADLARPQKLDREADRQRLDEVQRRDLRDRDQIEQGKALGLERERSRADESLRRDFRNGEQLEKGALGQQRERSRADESLGRELRKNGQIEEQQRALRQQERQKSDELESTLRQQRERQQMEQRSRLQSEDQQRALRQQQERQQVEQRSRLQSEDQQRALRQQQERQQVEQRSRKQAEEQQRALRQQQERQQVEQRSRQQAEQQRALRQQQERQQMEQRSRQQADQQRAYQQQQQMQLQRQQQAQQLQRQQQQQQQQQFQRQQQQQQIQRQQQRPPPQQQQQRTERQSQQPRSSSSSRNRDRNDRD
jgi:hypothetical protein